LKKPHERFQMTKEIEHGAKVHEIAVKSLIGSLTPSDIEKELSACDKRVEKLWANLRPFIEWL
jgi:hypothetical protein